MSPKNPLKQLVKQTWYNFTEPLLMDLAAGEELSLGLVGEDSLFLRFNQGKVRQATAVKQQTVEMQFQSQGRKARFHFSLTDDPSFNLQTGRDLLLRARKEVDSLPEDPHLTPLRNEGCSDQDLSARLPSADEAITQIIAAHGKTDFAGFYSGGPMYRASRNSLGQNHWFSTDCFFYDYSLFTVSSPDSTGKTQNKAVKGNYSEKNWNPENLRNNLQTNIDLLPQLRKPSYHLQPGTYRAYLAPGAVSEVLGTLISAFGAADFKQGRSAMTRLANATLANATLANATETLSPLFSLKENFGLGVCPQFNSLGEMAPRELSLVDKGELKNWIVSSKTAKEYNLVGNAGEITGWAPEMMRSPEISAGMLPQAQALAALGTGVWLGNLHYLNWSDITTARITGMTRYACFWVENGQIQAPIQDMRFDDSLYQILGPELEALTLEQTLEPNIMTYGRRELGARKFPGALLKKLKFTL